MTSTAERTWVRSVTAAKKLMRAFKQMMKCVLRKRLCDEVVRFMKMHWSISNEERVIQVKSMAKAVTEMVKRIKVRWKQRRQSWISCREKSVPRAF